MRMRDLATTRVRYGYRRVHVLLAREGWRVNHTRVYRLYRQEGRSLRLKTHKKRVSRTRVVQPLSTTPNQRWRMDFMTDSLYDGRRFRIVTFVDTMTRASPHSAVERSFTGEQVATILEQRARQGQLPQAIQVDNGPEFTSKALDAWAARTQVKLLCSRPGTPTDNPFIEAFNGRVRQECLNQNWFESREDARALIEAWRIDDHTARPHTALNNQSPATFTADWLRKQCLSENG